jgi:hypothetical protein
MLYEPTTLANVARIIGETLQKDYGIDPAPIFEQVKIDTSKFGRPGSRVPLSKMTRLWDTAVFITDDQQFGLKAGVRAEPSDFYVLGHAWLASATLKGPRLPRPRSWTKTIWSCSSSPFRIRRS